MTLTATIACALIEADGLAKPGLTDAIYDDYELRARYVLEALRDATLTDKMLDYGHPELTKHQPPDDLRHAWKAMMIAALED